MALFERIETKLLIWCLCTAEPLGRPTSRWNAVSNQALDTRHYFNRGNEVRFWHLADVEPVMGDVSVVGGIVLQNSQNAVRQNFR